MGLSAEELRRKYQELEQGGFQIEELFRFGEELGTSHELELHFELILEDWRRPPSKRWDPDFFFRLHRQEGITFLRGLLYTEDRERAVMAAYLLAELLMKGRYEDQEKLWEELDRALVLFAESEAPEHRRKSLIALGWAGTTKELPTLKRHLLSDEDSLCRAWSSSAFLQLSGSRIPAEVLRKEVGDELISCLENETDVFVRGVAVETVQDIWKVKFGLRGSAVDDRNQKAVDRAAAKALKYLKEQRDSGGQEGAL